MIELKWCEHCVLGLNGKQYVSGGVYISDSWKYCPVCGTSKPSKTVEEIMAKFDELVKWMKGGV